MTYETQWRATFEDTKNHQEELRKKIYNLIRENRCLKNNTERDNFFELLNNSTFGITKNITLNLPNHTTIKIPDLQQFIRSLFDYEKNIVTNDFFFEHIGENKQYNIEIKHLWKQILINLYHIFPSALETSVRISKEREQRDFSAEGGFRFGKKKPS